MIEQEKNSVVDNLYYRLYGEHQTKEGQALERLSAVAFKLLEEARKVQYDQQVRAKYSQTVYQVDGLIGEGDQQVMVEAKDYTVRGDKVGRADLQKLEGALTDLDIAEGRFVSATDYTNRAKPYAKSTENNPKQNPISLYHVRPSTSDDEKGRITTIEVRIKMPGLEFEKGQYRPHINSDFLERIKDKIPVEGKDVRSIFFNFYDENGNVVDTFLNVTSQLNKRLSLEIEKGYVLEGKWDFPQPLYMDMEPLGRVLIDSFYYKIPTYIDECTFSINQDGQPVLLVKSEDGVINKLFTEEELKQFKFEEGEVKRIT